MNPEQYDWHNLLFDERYLLDKHYTPGRGGASIEFVTIHHMIILNRDISSPDALRTLRNVWEDREASAHYGVDGKFVGQFVNDFDTAWCNADFWANQRTIGIEHANQTLDASGTQSDYLVDEETWKTGAKLTAAIHKAYNLGSPVMNKTVRRHSEFTSTSCPGPYLGQAIWNEYNDHVGYCYDELMAGRVPDASVIAPPPVANTNGEYIVQSGDTLAKIAARHNMRWQDLQTLNGLNNPNLIRVGQVLRVNGAAELPIGNVVEEVIQGMWGNDPERSQRLQAAGYDPVAVQNEVNLRLG